MVNVKKKFIIFIGLLFFSSGIISAQPEINSVFGNLSDGESITITGSGFGSKSPAAPILWETFDSGNNGGYISQNENWEAYSGNGAKYSSTNPYGEEGFSAYNYVEYGGDKEFDTNVFYYDPSDELYYSYMSRHEGTSVWDGVYKNGRINTGTNRYSGEGMIAISHGYIFYRPGSSSVYPDDRRFSLVSDMVKSNNWHRHQLYGKLSDPPGSTNGLIYAQVHTERKTYEDIVSRETGYSFQYGTIILGLMFANLESGDYHHMYIDDVYIDNTQARVEICSGSTWSSRGVCDIQIPYEWNSDSVKVNINQGSFNKDDTAYVFVIDKEGKVNSEGYQITISDKNNQNQGYCGDGNCDSGSGENCDNCPEDCLNSETEICCSGVAYTGNCCSDSDCSSGWECVDYNCEEIELQENQTIINVDSTYSGYSKDKISDDVIDAYGMEDTTWASAGSNTEPHWIEFVFSEGMQITNLSVYWAYNPTLENFMSSQEVYIQAYDPFNENYFNVSFIDNSDSVESSFKDFEVVNTTRLRLWQPADKGYSGYSSVIWLTEVDYGVVKALDSGTIQETHPADNNNDGFVDFSEISDYLDEWLNGNITIDELLSGINKWRGF